MLPINQAQFEALPLGERAGLIVEREYHDLKERKEAAVLAIAQKAVYHLQDTQGAHTQPLKRRLVINLGHGVRTDGGYDPGAINAAHKVDEAAWVRRFGIALAEALTALGWHNFVILQSGDWGALPELINAASPSRIISYHLNAFNGKASGTETLQWHTNTDNYVGNRLINATTSVLQLPNRGIKTIKEGARGAYLFANTAAPCWLHELFFVDNDGDLTLGTANFAKLVDAHAAAIVEICNA